jgi:hypothetical protein
MSANTVLLPRVFPSDLVSLGQIVRNPLTPNIDTYTKGCTHIKAFDDVTDPTSDRPFSVIVSTDARGRFDVGLTKYLGAKLHGRKTSFLSIQAEKLEYQSLKNASDMFKRICDADEEAKKWISDMVLHRTPCFFVVGLQTLYNAEFNRAVLKEGGAGGFVTVPLEATAQIPLHIQGELAADRFGKSTGKKVSGVFGIEVQKLNSRIGPVGDPTLKGDVSWHWTYQRVKGPQAEADK